MPNRFDSRLAHDQKLRARAQRAQFLTMIFEDQISQGDLIDLAATGTPTGLNLRKIKLVDLLEASTRQSRAACYRTLEEIMRRCGETKRKPSSLDLVWLLDGRTANRRLLIWADALSPLNGSLPWPHFPFGGGQ